MISPPSRWQMELESGVVGWGTVGLVSPGTGMLPMLLPMLTHLKPPIDCPTLGLSHRLNCPQIPSTNPSDVGQIGSGEYDQVTAVLGLLAAGCGTGDVQAKFDKTCLVAH